MRKLWTLTLDGKTLRLVDFPAAAIDDVAMQVSCGSHELVVLPLGQPTLLPARMLLARGAQVLNVAAPPGEMTVAEVMDRFDTILEEDDRQAANESGVADGKWWRITIAERTLRLVDFPCGVIEDIAAAHGCMWFDLLDRPVRQRTYGPALTLLARAAQILDVEAPEGITVDALERSFDLVDPDVPELDDPDPDGRVDPTGPASSTAGSSS